MNVLAILTDQQRYDSLACNGAAICRTPHLDRLASEGTNFRQAYTTTSVCSPARVSMLTGVYPHIHGVRTNTNEPRLWPTSEIPDGLPTIGQHLREAGYQCGYSGKWHCGEKRMPQDYGFEGMGEPGYGRPYAMAEYAAYCRESGLPPPPDFAIAKNNATASVPEELQVAPAPLWAGARLPGGREAGEPAYVTAHAIDLLDRYARDWREQRRPFFQFVSFWGPHHPSILPDPYLDMYDPADVELWPSFVDHLRGKPAVHDLYRRSFYHEHVDFSEDDWRAVIARYWGYCTYIDDEIGRLLAALEERGVHEETAVIFTSDHGDMLGSHGGIFDKGEFMYEETYHIPMIARVPGLEPGVCDRLVSNLDLPSTVLDLAGLPVPEHHQGRSLLPLLRHHDAPWREDLLCEFHGLRIGYNQRMLRWDRYKYVFNSPDIDELYDLESDPYELHNRIDDPTLDTVAHECRQRLLRAMRETDDVMMGTAWQQLNFRYDGREAVTFGARKMEEAPT